LEIIARAREGLREGAEILEMNMPYDGRGFLRHCVSFQTELSFRFLAAHGIRIPPRVIDSLPRAGGRLRPVAVGAIRQQDFAPLRPQ
jgi:hypothetical protein